MPSLFSSSVRKSEFVSMRSGVSNSEPTAMISAFILRKSRESRNFLPFFCGDHAARILFGVSIQECSRKILQVVCKPSERIKRILRKTRIFIAAVRAQYRVHVALAIEVSLSEVIGTQSHRLP